MSVLDLFRLDGRRALITGGSRGLGRAIAGALAEAGADLVLAGRTADSLEQARAELAPLGRRVEVVQADVGSGEGAAVLCAEVLARCGPVDILVNNVGGRREDVSIGEEPLETWRRYLELNLTGAFACIQRLGQPMLERGWGRIINVASIAGPIVAIRGIGGRHYETAKAGLVGLTRSVAADWAARGVTVNAIAPGGFLTDANRRWFAERPEFKKEFEAQVPMGRLGEPEEIGPLALYLASEASRYMTGAVLVLDGGYTVW